MQRTLSKAAWGTSRSATGWGSSSQSSKAALTLNMGLVSGLTWTTSPTFFSSSNQFLIIF